MIIVETNIPNVVPDNINHSKTVLANNIISNVYPLFNEVYSTRVEEIERLEKNYKEKEIQLRSTRLH